MKTVIQVGNVSKQYRLGTLGSGTAAEDLRRWFNRAVLRKPPKNSPVPPDYHGNIEGDILWALRDINFKVNEGEIVGIIGRNGAGKSTLLKILSQVTAPSTGVVRYKGRLASLLEVGTGFNGELTGRENIYLNGSILGMTPREIRRRFDEIVEFAEIGDFVDTPVKRYSSGMYVRLAFAVAAHLETEIMVVDEVLAVGDVGFQKRCIGKMSDVSHKGRTILFVSHRMDHITALCSRSLVLNKGRIVFDGPTDEAVKRYYGSFDRQNSSDMTNRMDREGEGNIVIREVRLETGDGRQAETLMTGQPVEFVVEIENLTNEPAKNILVGVAIFEAGGSFLCSLTSTEGGIHAFDFGRRCTVRLKIPRLPLNCGSFYFDCGVARRTIGPLVMEDKIEAAGKFSVDYGDYHGIGFASGGLFSIEHSAIIECAEGKIAAGQEI